MTRLRAFLCTLPVLGRFLRPPFHVPLRLRFTEHGQQQDRVVPVPWAMYRAMKGYLTVLPMGHQRIEVAG